MGKKSDRLLLHLVAYPQILKVDYTMKSYLQNPKLKALFDSMPDSIKSALEKEPSPKIVQVSLSDEPEIEEENVRDWDWLGNYSFRTGRVEYWRDI